MKKAIVTAMHKYTPFGDEFYEPIFNFFLTNLGKYQDEFDSVYIVDSTWNIKEKGFNFPEINFNNLNPIKVIKVSPHLRYYDAYKEVLPQIKEDLVLFMDNDMVVYRKGIIKKTFDLLDKEYQKKQERPLTIRKAIPGDKNITSDGNVADWSFPGAYDVISIYDTIGTYKTDKMNGKNKFCLYFFSARKDLLMKYLDVEWGSNMPEHETLGKLTEKMLNDTIVPYEFPEDKNSIYFDGKQDGEKGKDLGYYHIRAGSTPAYLLATKKYGNIDTYNDYIKNQPENEYLRQLMWYYYMGIGQEINENVRILLDDLDISQSDWFTYFKKFRDYHNLL